MRLQEYDEAYLKKVCICKYDPLFREQEDKEDFERSLWPLKTQSAEAQNEIHWIEKCHPDHDDKDEAQEWNWVERVVVKSLKLLVQETSVRVIKIVGKDILSWQQLVFDHSDQLFV